MYSSEIDTKIRRAPKVKGAAALKGSDFIITINTNKSKFSANEEVIKRMPEIERKFGELVKNLFSESNLPKLVREVEKIDGKNVQKVPGPGKIVSVKAKTVIESTENGLGYLHAHTYIHIEHKTKVQIDLNLIKKVTYSVLKETLTFNGKFLKPFIGIKGVNSSSTSLKRYVD